MIFKKILVYTLVWQITMMPALQAMRGGELETGLLESDTGSSHLLPKGAPSADLETSAEDKEGQTSSRESFLSALGLSPEEVKDPTTFDKLFKVESSLLRSTFRWTNVDSLIQRILESFVLRKEDLTGETPPKKLLSPPLWIQGRALPLASSRAQSNVAFMEGLKQGTEFVLFRSIHATLLGLLGYQLYLSDGSPAGVLNIFRNSDENGARDIAYLLAQASQKSQKYAFGSALLKGLLSVPFLWGPVKGLVAMGTRPDEKDLRTKTKEISNFPRGFWQDYGRWLLPLHPIDRRINALKAALLWDGTLSRATRKDMFEALKALASKRQGYTRISGMHGFATLANGMHLGDFARYISNTQELQTVRGSTNLLRKSTDQETLQQLLSLKVRALAELEKLSTFQGTWKERVLQFPRVLYGRYLLWSLGQSPTKAEALAFTTFKLGKLAYLGHYFDTLIGAVLDYLNCQNKPGFTFSGYQSWASDYTAECFNQLVSLFNIIPGQPASSLVDLIPQYHFPGNIYSLNMTGKGVNALTLAEVVNGFTTNGISLQAAYLGGNIVGGGSIGEATQDYLNLWKALEAHKSLLYLDLSNNGIGGYLLIIFPIPSDPMIAVGLGNALKQWPLLTSLDLNGNLIGSNDNINATGTMALGQGIGQLSSLTSLDLSENWIGFYDYINPTGTMALGQGIGQVSSLASLDLSGNYIGRGDGSNATGTMVLGEGIGKLSSLTSLDLSGNNIGYGDYNNANGTMALGQGIGQLSSLTSLDLTQNYIGYGDSINPAGTIAVGEGIGHLSSLASLDLNENYIGLHDSTNLNGTMSITQNLKALHALQSFLFLPQQYTPLDPAAGTLLNQALSSLNLPFLSFPFPDLNSIDAYFAKLPFNTEIINLSGLFPASNLTLTEAVFQRIMMFSWLKSLNLSFNAIGENDYEDPTSTIAIGNNLGQLPSLTSLDLSGNQIGSGDEFNATGTVALGQGIGQLSSLTFLDLSSNQIGFNDGWNATGTMALGQEIRHLSSLISLDLSGNQIGCWDNTNATGTMALGQGIGQLSSLTFLNLSNNPVGSNDNTNPNGTMALGEGIGQLSSLTSLDLDWNSIGLWDDSNVAGTVALGQGIGQLPFLNSLDLSGNYIGYCDDSNANGTIALGQGTGQVSSLTSLDVSTNWIGSNDDSNANGTVALGKGIGQLSSLTSLDLSGNNIGGWDNINTSGTLAIAQGVGHIKSLSTLNLQSNSIGTAGPQSPAVFLDSIAQLPNLENLNLQGMTNVSWVQGAAALQGVRRTTLQAACEAQICTGKPLATPTPTPVPTVAISPAALATKSTKAEPFVPSPVTRVSSLRVKDKATPSYARSSSSKPQDSRDHPDSQPSFDDQSQSHSPMVTSAASQLQTPFDQVRGVSLSLWSNAKTLLGRGYESLLNHITASLTDVVTTSPSYFSSATSSLHGQTPKNGYFSPSNAVSTPANATLPAASGGFLP